MMFLMTKSKKNAEFGRFRHISNNTRLLQKRKTDKVSLSMDPKEKNAVYSYMKQ